MQVRWMIVQHKMAPTEVMRIAALVLSKILEKENEEEMCLSNEEKSKGII